MAKSPLILLGIPVVACLVLGCASRNQKPLYASSAESAGYATRYPTMLASSRERLTEQETDARAAIAEIRAYPGSLESQSWEETAKLVDQAESDGKSEEYAKQYEETQQIADFYEEEKGEINKSVAGSVQYAAQQNKCGDGGKLGGAATHALEKAIEKRQKERLRSMSEAHRALGRQEERFGKKNVDAMGEQLDKISETSYLVNVGVEATRRDLESRASEASKAKGTLDDEIELLDALVKDPDTRPGDRKVAEKQLEEARVAQGQLDAEAKQAEQIAKDAPKRIDALRKEFSDAMDALRTELKKRADAQAAAAPKK